ncbi:tudor domain-containing protein 15 [Synchiropus picturatus]
MSSYSQQQQQQLTHLTETPLAFSDQFQAIRRRLTGSDVRGQADARFSSGSGVAHLEPVEVSPRRPLEGCDETCCGLGESHLGESHLGESHLGESHLGESHLGESHLGETHLGESRLRRSGELEASWWVELKLTHLDWSPETSLIQFQGQHPDVCELDYSILQGELLHVPKSRAALSLGDTCLVEELPSGRWHRGRVQGRQGDLLEVFLIDRGSSLSVGASRVSSCPARLRSLPPKVVCGFLSNVLLFSGCCRAVMQEFFSSLLKSNVKGLVTATLPHQVLLLEVPAVNSHIVVNGFGRHVDSHSFLLLVELLTEVPLERSALPLPGPEGALPSLASRAPGWGGGSGVQVRVTAAFRPGLFYCREASRDAELQDLCSRLAAACEDGSPAGRRGPEENLGSLCAVQHRDGRWYRGLVQLVASNTEVRAWFVDCGFFESVEVRKIQKLPPGLYSAPLMALPCALASCEPQQLDLLKAGILGDVLHLEVVGHEDNGNLYLVRASKLLDARGSEPQARALAVAQAPAPPLFCHLAGEGNVAEQLLNMALKEENILPDASFVGYVEHVQDPDHFWVRSQKRNEAFEEMMEKVRAHYSQLRLEQDTLTRPQVGSLCGAVYLEDRHFYRGLVVDVLQHHARVLFLDFGNVERVPHKLIKKLPDSLAEAPPFALRCSLSGVFPLEELWTLSNSSRFRTLTANKELEVRVVQIRSDALLVDLWHAGRSISHTLVSTWDALFRDTPRPHGLPPVSHADRRSAGLRQDPVSPSKPKASVPPETFLYSSFDLSPGSEEEVYVCHLSGPGELYCQLRRNLRTLQELEQSVVEEAAGPERPGRLMETLCLAKYQDGSWYRGVASPVLSPRHLAVFFVDYGNSNIYERRNVKFLRKEAQRLLRVPMQAVRLSLARVPREEQQHPELRSWLEQTILHREVRAVIRGGAAQRSFHAQLFHGDTNINLELNKLLLSLSPTLPVKAHRALTPRASAPTARHVGGKGPADGATGGRSGPARARSTKASGVEKRRQKTGPRRTPGVSRRAPRSIPERKVGAGRKECYVSHINSAQDFFLQLAEDEAAILQLHQELRLLLSGGGAAAASCVEVGDVVLASYHEDGLLYRAAVTAQEGGAAFTVHFLDYGNSAVVEKEKVFALPSSYASRPRWSIACALLDASVYGSDAAFSRAVSEKLLAVDFVQRLQASWKVNIEVIGEEEASPALEAGGQGPAAEATVVEVEATVEEVEAEEVEATVEAEEVKATVEEVEATVEAEEDVETEDVSTVESVFWMPAGTEAEACSHAQYSAAGRAAAEASALGWDVQAGDTESGVVLSVLENGNFFFRLNRSNDWAAHVESYIAERIFTCRALRGVQEGARCLVEVGHLWRRGQVLQVREQVCRVLLQDQGLTVETPSGSLRAQGSPLAEVPNLALLCRRGALGGRCRALAPVLGQEVHLKFVRYCEAEQLWWVEMVSSERRQRPPDGGPQHLSLAPVAVDAPLRAAVSACHLPSDFSLLPEASLPLLATVSSATQGFCGDSPPLPEAQLRPGACCMFESDSKGKWCRAQIAHVGQDHLLLDLLDYGHRERLPCLHLRRLRRLPTGLLDLPRATYPCALRGVRPAGPGAAWSEDALALFQRLLRGPDLQLLVREWAAEARRLTVDAVVGGVQVARQLVLAGHARHTDPLLQLRSGSALTGPDRPLTLLFLPGGFLPPTNRRRTSQSSLALLSEEEEESQAPPLSHRRVHCFVRPRVLVHVPLVEDRSSDASAAEKSVFINDLQKDETAFI